MGPKPKSSAPSKKTVEKKKEKVIEDKTFGLKNKKGAKQQKFIQQVEKQVKSGGPVRKAAEDPLKKKEDKAKLEKELGLLFRPVQKVEKGADPKSVVCAFFKQGQCSKGAKCKFSHDLTVERKAEKRSLYVDMRDDGDENETNENWDEEKLKEVVEQKHGEAEKKRPTTTIICKYFIDAVENSKYGWFWSCPNGSSCIYKHALPPGFVLKKDRKKEDKKDQISLEDLIERERAALAASSKFTKVTLESFLSWKKRKLKEKAEALTKAEDKKRSDYKAGKQVGLSGREMFSFNPELARGDVDDGDEGDEVFDSNIREEDEQDPESNYRDLDLDMLINEVLDVDEENISQARDRVFDTSKTSSKHNGETSDNTEDSTDKDKDSADDNDEGKSKEEEGAAGVINENLFEDDVDLDELEEELDDLSI